VPLVEALAEPGMFASMPGHGLRAQVEEAAQELGVRVEAAIELRSQQALLAMVAAGGGIAFAPSMSVTGRGDEVAVRLDPGLVRELGWCGAGTACLPGLLLGWSAEQAAAGPESVDCGPRDYLRGLSMTTETKVRTSPSHSTGCIPWRLGQRVGPPLVLPRLSGHARLGHAARALCDRYHILARPAGTAVDWRRITAERRVEDLEAFGGDG
jgi:hypothetical protein